MKPLLIMVMLTTCAATVQDLSSKMFTFPMETDTAHVRLTPSTQEFAAVTVCHRSFTDLRRSHSLFSLATPSNENGFLVFWDDSKKNMESIVKNQESLYGGLDYKPNVWHSLCTTWDSESGLVQMWFNGKALVRKFLVSGGTIQAPLTIVLGQEQDNHGGGFDLKQSFVGMMSDVHMWDYTLSACEIQNYVDETSFTPGNVLNWRELDYQITGKVLVESKVTVCQ